MPLVPGSRFGVFEVTRLDRTVALKVLPELFEGYFREIGKKSPDDSLRSLTVDERMARDQRYGIRYR